MITTATTLHDIKQDKILKEVWPYLIYNTTGDGAGNFVDDSLTLNDIQKKNPTWLADDMAYGLNTIIEMTEQLDGSGMSFLNSVYSDKEIADDSERACVKLMFFPSVKEKKINKTAILAAGGGYGAVCSMCEAFPVAARLRELGIDVFCLNYRVASNPPLFPKPFEDMAAAVRYLVKNKDYFGISMENYGVGGFSAGGHLASCWGTSELGYRKYNLPKPDLLLLAYPLINVWKTLSQLPKSIRDLMLTGYFGDDATESMCRKYNVDEHVDGEYPTAYIVQAENDTTVPVCNTKDMAKILKELNIKCQYELVQDGGHGFGLGTNTSAEGWVDRACEFWLSLDE